METTIKQPGGGPAMATSVRCQPRPASSGTCRDCGAALMWVTRRDGSALAMNATPLTMITQVEGDADSFEVEGVPHWTTCTHAR
jgi:hypothetical protein